MGTAGVWFNAVVVAGATTAAESEVGVSEPLRVESVDRLVAGRAGASPCTGGVVVLSARGIEVVDVASIGATGHGPDIAAVPFGLMGNPDVPTGVLAIMTRISAALCVSASSRSGVVGREAVIVRGVWYDAG